MRTPTLLAVYPPDALRHLQRRLHSAGVLCLGVAGAIRLDATDVTFRRRAVRGWLIAAGVGVCVCAVLRIAARLLSVP